MIAQSSTFSSIFYYSKKEARSLNIFWIGVLLYSLGFVFSRLGHFSSAICNAIQALGILFFLYGSVFLIHLRISNIYLRILFILYFIWSASVISRGIKFDHVSNHVMLFDANYGIFIYFAPLIILFPNNLLFYKKAFDAIMVFGIAFLLCNVLFIKDMLNRSAETRDIIEYFAKLLSLTTGFILLTYTFHTRKRNLLAFAIMMLTILFSVYKARRGLMLIGLSSLFFAYVFYWIYTKNKLFVIYITVLMVASGIFFANKFYKVSKDGLLGLVTERGDEDTRTVVEIFFDVDMQSKDWIIGKGINGDYFCPDCEEEQETNNRAYIETGYLQIILKGGIIMLGLFLLIAIPAVILGIFFSKNMLSKAASIWISIALFSLYPTTVNIFTFQFLLVWISIRICYSKNLRKLTNDDIRNFMQNGNAYTQFYEQPILETV